jgi:A/G-specific adenine glycosylase
MADPAQMSAFLQLNSGQISRLREALLAWYDKCHRDLPWRGTRDPYRVWVSEIMLQQTRVAAVWLHYEKFLRRFPTVHKLAAARESAVLSQWSGLGYYRRARNLHRAAKIIARQRPHKFPRTADRWRELPGIGRYTAAAIASIAFKQPVAVLDGNVERVLHRLRGSTRQKANLWSAAEELLDRPRPGDFNQAMMELGATVCLPAAPRCSNCPIRAFCRTRGPGGMPNRKLPQDKREITYSLARRVGSVLLVQRSKNHRLMPGMWELPEVVGGLSEKRLFSLKHSITVTDFTVHVVNDPGRQDGKWIQTSRLSTLPLTGLTRKILRRAEIIQ